MKRIAAIGKESPRIFSLPAAYPALKGGGGVEKAIEERCMLLGRYILLTGATVRQAAKHFDMSKSSVHKDVHERLRLVHPGLYEEVKQVLDYHHAVRHIRGGQATRRRCKLLRANAGQG